MAPTPFEEYAALMNRNGDGYYLYKPQPYAKLHPGVIGFFDRHGGWTTVTDVSIPGKPQEDGYGPFGVEMVKDKPETVTWDSRASSSEAQHSFGIDAGLSGAASAAPVDVSAEAKNKWGQTGKAALVAEHVVIHEKFRTPWGKPLANWIKANAKALVKGPWEVEIKKYGLWAINKTWTTQECKITMDSAHNRDTGGGFDVGATGIAKGGLSGSSAVKGDSQGWTTFKAAEDDNGLVVSYGGNGFKLSTFSKMFNRGPLKEIATIRLNETEQRTAPQEYMRAVYDENGEHIGDAYFRPVFDADGNEIGEEQIDKEAEKKKREEEERKREEEEKMLRENDATEEDEEIEIEFGDIVGETEEEQKAEEQELHRKAAEIMKLNLSDDQKRAALHELFAPERVVTISAS